MGKKSRGKSRYQPAPWSDDYDAKKKGGTAPWHRKSDRHKAPWSNPLAGLTRGGRR
jgi:hypothetical protein